MENRRLKDPPRPLVVGLFAVVEVVALVVAWLYELKLVFVALAVLGITIGTALLMRSYLERRKDVSSMNRSSLLVMSVVLIALVLAMAVIGELLLIRALSLVAAVMISVILAAGVWLARGQRRHS
jgi:hypothetical protein